MKCITFGWLLFLTIIIAVIGAATGLETIGSLVSGGLLLWWIAGFFVPCDGYFGMM